MLKTFQVKSDLIDFYRVYFVQKEIEFFSDLYTRVWDEADYVVPPAENGAFFVATNVIITPNQTRGKIYNFHQIK